MIKKILITLIGILVALVLLMFGGLYFLINYPGDNLRVPQYIADILCPGFMVEDCPDFCRVCVSCLEYCADNVCRSPEFCENQIINCRKFTIEACPEGCVVSPVCPMCDAIRCDTLEFCESLGLTREQCLEKRTSIIKESTKSSVGIANPASTFCEENGGTLEIRSDPDGNQFGVCIFADGTFCEEWEFFRGTCTR